MFAQKIENILGKICKLQKMKLFPCSQTNYNILFSWDRIYYSFTYSGKGRFRDNSILVSMNAKKLQINTKKFQKILKKRKIVNMRVNYK